MITDIAAVLEAKRAFQAQYRDQLLAGPVLVFTDAGPCLEVRARNGSKLPTSFRGLTVKALL